MQYTYWDFFHCSKQFLNWLILMPFSASAVFYFASSKSAKCFPLRTFFIWGSKKKVAQGKIGWIEKVGHRGHAIFGQKLLSTQRGAGRCTCKSPIMKWAIVLKESWKQFTEAERSLSQQHQLVHWYRCVPRTLMNKSGTNTVNWEVDKNHQVHEQLNNPFY